MAVNGLTDFTTITKGQVAPRPLTVHDHCGKQSV